MNRPALVLVATIAAIAAIATAACQPARHASRTGDVMLETAPADSVSVATQRTPATAAAVVGFWEGAGPSMWFAKDAAFDKRFRERFAPLYEDAAAGRLESWEATPEGALALVILLDQYPRNSFRGTPRMYSTDALARRIADTAIAAGHDRRASPELQIFFYLPFAHSEALADQDRSVELARRLGEPTLGRAEHHRDIVRRFGRFPHRNPILGRTTTAEEQRYLDEGGFKG
jgi:uncharacterized protein (DUF924 family)